MEKTNVMRVLEQKKIPYEAHCYVETGKVAGLEVAEALGEDPRQVFKTLVTIGASKKYYVFVVPVNKELHLKKAAKAVGEKSIAMIKAKELLPLTGYVHGGCSPLGMKKLFPTYIDSSAQELERIYVSAGKIGAQVFVSPKDLAKVCGARFAEITV